MAKLIQLSQKVDDLEICIDGQCLALREYHQRPRLLTLDPMRILLSKHRSKVVDLQHQLHMLTGWLGMAMNAVRALWEAKKIRVGDVFEIEV